MSPKTIFRFQFGCADAIREVAGYRGAPFVGIILVLITAIARNYDQLYFKETPFWLFGSLLFSLFSGYFLFLCLYRFLSRTPEGVSKPSRWDQWRVFMGLFWMTAPIAWLYAIPMERMLSTYQATQANLTLLATVATWRVLLMSRILSVLLQIPFKQAFLRVFWAASVEVLFVSLGGMAKGIRLIASMGGMRNAPEENLLGSVYSSVIIAALLLSFVIPFIMAYHATKEPHQPLPIPSSGKFPGFTLLLLGIIWVGIAIPAQKEQYRFFTHAGLIEQGKYRESVDYLTKHKPEDFPPSRRLEPNPYESRVFRQLPPLMEVLKPTDSAWIKEHYLDVVGAFLSHGYFYFGDEKGHKDLLTVLSAIEKLDPGQDWFLRNYEHIERAFSFLAWDKKNPLSVMQLQNLSERLGLKYKPAKN